MRRNLLIGGLIWFGFLTMLGIRYDRFPEVLIGGFEIYLAVSVIVLFSTRCSHWLLRRFREIGKARHQ